jgi:predicted nucleotidyltransferase
VPQAQDILAWRVYKYVTHLCNILHNTLFFRLNQALPNIGIIVPKSGKVFKFESMPAIMHSEEKIYKAFYESKKNKIYFNELKDLTKLSNSSLQNILKTAIDNKTLEKQETKANTFFIIKNKRLFAIEYAKIAINKFELLHRNVRLPLNDFIKKIPGEVISILIFGSAARNAETEKSDVDLLIILHRFENENMQKEYEKRIIKQIEDAKKDIQAQSIHHLSLAFTTTRGFIEGKDHLVNQAKETGFPIINEQLYFEMLQNEH